MAGSEERLRILQMLEAGRLSVDEAAKLLAAIRETPREAASGATRPWAAAGRSGSRWFRVRVTDLTTNRTKVSVNMPVAVVSALARLGSRFVPQSDEFNMQRVVEAIRNGEVGQIVDIVDEEDGEHVEVFIE